MYVQDANMDYGCKYKYLKLEYVQLSKITAL